MAKQQAIEPHISEWMLTRIAERDRRNWAACPYGFELDAVRAAYRDILPMFDPRNIRERINASRAQTFTELREAING